MILQIRFWWNCDFGSHFWVSGIGVYGFGTMILGFSIFRTGREWGKVVFVQSSCCFSIWDEGLSCFVQSSSSKLFLNLRWWRLGDFGSCCFCYGLLFLLLVMMNNMKKNTQERIGRRKMKSRAFLSFHVCMCNQTCHVS